MTDLAVFIFHGFIGLGQEEQIFACVLFVYSATPKKKDDLKNFWYNEPSICILYCEPILLIKLIFYRSTCALLKLECTH